MINLSPSLTSRQTLRHAQAGFTLLELMISISLIAIMVLIIFGALRLGFRSVESGERRIEALTRTRASFEIITAQIQSNLPLSYMDNASKKFYFRGSKDVLQLTTNYSLWGGQRGYALVTYRVDADGSGKHALIATESTVGLDNSRETTLLQNYDSILFEYYYKGPTDQEGKWVEEWTEETSIPEKVRLTFLDGSKKIATVIPLPVHGTTAGANQNVPGSTPGSNFGPLPAPPSPN